MKENKEYSVTEEMQEIFLDYLSANSCKVGCVASVFNTKKAIRYGKLAEKARTKFWQLVYALYPELTEDDVSATYKYRQDPPVVIANTQPNK